VQAEKLALNAEDIPEEEKTTAELEDDLTVYEAISKGPPLHETVEGVSQFTENVKETYTRDTLFKQIIQKPEEHPQFIKVDGLLFTVNRGGDNVLCVPQEIDMETNKSFVSRVIEAAHKIVGHFSIFKTSNYHL
jgi:hypothetical protein